MALQLQIEKATREQKKLRLLTTAPTGSGKAQKMTSKLLTPTGWITMSEAKIGTVLINPEGGTTTIIGVHPQGVIPVYKFTFSDDSVTHGCAEHLWKYKKEGCCCWEVGDTKKLIALIENREVVIPLVSNVEFELEPALPPTLVGQLYSEYDLAINPKSEYLTSGKVIIYPSVFSSLPIDVRLPIPKEYLFAVGYNRRELLTSLIANGRSTSTTYTTLLPYLAEAVVFLVQSLGGTANKIELVDDNENYISSLVEMQLPIDYNPFEFTLRSDSYQKNKLEIKRTIKNISYDGEEECQCISVDSDNHLYVTDDFIVTHNTFSSLLLAKGLTESGKVLVLDTENRRSSLKVGDPVFGDWTWDAIYTTPAEATSQLYMDVIQAAVDNEYDAVVLDSVTHEWDWCMSQWQMRGGKWGDSYNKSVLSHHHFVKAMIAAPIHILCTARSKMASDMQEGADGKKTVVKLGLETKQQGDFAYEVDFVFDIQNANHVCLCSKREGGLFENPFIVTADTGVQLREFLAVGITPEEKKKKEYASKIRSYHSQLIGLKAFDEREADKRLSEILPRSLAEILAYGKQIRAEVESLTAVDQLEALGNAMAAEVKAEREASVESFTLLVEPAPIQAPAQLQEDDIPY